MARTFTIQIPLGFSAPEFNLPNVVTGKMNSLADLKSDQATLVMFISNHCPFVKHVIKELVELAHDYIPKGLSIIAISSNDVINYPDDHPDRMKELAEQLNFPFPYLFDESQEIARAYDAACTPDFNLFDHQMKCVYRGQLDNSRPGNGIEVNGNDLRKAIDYTLSKKKIDWQEKPSVGCNIKWKS